MTQARAQVTMGQRTHLLRSTVAGSPYPITLQVRPIVPVRMYLAEGVLMHTTPWGFKYGRGHA